jgi:hypothetical protein
LETCQPGKLDTSKKPNAKENLFRTVPVPGGGRRCPGRRRTRRILFSFYFRLAAHHARPGPRMPRTALHRLPLPQHPSQGSAFAVRQPGGQLEQQGESRGRRTVQKCAGFCAARPGDTRFFGCNSRFVRLLSGVLIDHVLNGPEMTGDENPQFSRGSTDSRTLLDPSRRLLTASFCASSVRRRPTPSSPSASTCGYAEMWSGSTGCSFSRSWKGGSVDDEWRTGG